MHNTSYNVRAGSGIVWVSAQGGAQATAVVMNNISYSDGVSPYVMAIHGAKPSQLTVNANLYYSYGQQPVPDKHAVKRDPLFRDAANGDFRLRPNSPAIDAGSNHATDRPSSSSIRR